METHLTVANLDSIELRQLAHLAGEAAVLARAFAGNSACDYVTLVAKCSVELWRRRQRVVSRCGTAAPHDSLPQPPVS